MLSGTGTFCISDSTYKAVASDQWPVKERAAGWGSGELVNATVVHSHQRTTYQRLF